MSQVTHRSPTLPSYGTGVSRPLPSRTAWFLEGVLAAGLGLGAFSVPVLLLWIISPYPDSEAGGALQIAADLWLLGHGSALVRTGTLSGVPAPVALTPLLLAVPPVWLLYRACVQALSRAGGAEAEERSGAREEQPPGVLAPLGCVAGGYLLTAAVAVLFASAGPVHADVLSASVRLPLFVLCVAAASLWPALVRTPEPDAGAPHGSAEREPASAAPPSANAAGRGRFPALRDAAMILGRMCPLRTALTAVAVLCGGGLLVLLGAVVWHAGEVHSAFPRLAGDSWTGEFAVLLLAVALLPNAVVWAAAYGLGPGFAIGASAAVGSMTQSGDRPWLPPFPLLEALPAADGGFSLFAFAAAGAAPLAAGATAGWYVGRAAAPLPGRCDDAVGRPGTACVVVLVACECAAVVAALAALSGGALGTGELALLGPDWRLTGIAAWLWVVLVGVPVALAVRSRRLREYDCDDEWHATAARQARWSALKAASGGLMPDFEPRRD